MQILVKITALPVPCRVRFISEAFLAPRRSRNALVTMLKLNFDFDAILVGFNRVKGEFWRGLGGKWVPKCDPTSKKSIKNEVLSLTLI